MRPYIYNVILAGLAAIILVIPFLGTVYLRQRGVKWYKRFTLKGRLLIVIFLITIDVGYHKDLQSDMDENIKKVKADSAARAERNENRAFILEQQRASNNQITNSRDSIVFALANSYNLLLDSTKKQIHSSSEQSKQLINKMMKDSALRQNRYIANSRPSVSINKILLTRQTADSVILQLKLKAEDNATAYEVNIRVAAGYIFKNIPFQYPGINNDAANGDQLSPGNFRTIEFRMPYNKGGYIFYIKGTYQDIPQLKLTYPLEQILYYDISKKTMSRLSPDLKSSALGYVKHWL